MSSKSDYVSIEELIWFIYAFKSLCKMYQRVKICYQLNAVSLFEVVNFLLTPYFLLFYQKRLFEWNVLLFCEESPKCSLRTWSVDELITVLFGFFVAMAISVKQKDPSALKRKVYPLLGSALDQWQYSLAAKSKRRATLNSTGNELTAFWFSILESRAT